MGNDNFSIFGVIVHNFGVMRPSWCHKMGTHMIKNQFLAHYVHKLAKIVHFLKHWGNDFLEVFGDIAHHSDVIWRHYGVPWRHWCHGAGVRCHTG